MSSSRESTIPLPVPETDNPTRQGILEAAIRCVKKWGVEKTNLNDIAKEAGVTRPTVYSYFANRHELLQAALYQSSMLLAQRLIAHVSAFESIADRFVESILFCLEELPKEPSLAVITRPDLASFVSEDALGAPQNWELVRHVTAHVFAPARLDPDDEAEIAEVACRMTLSLLIVDSPHQRDREALRGLIERRLVPMIPGAGSGHR